MPSHRIIISFLVLVATITSIEAANSSSTCIQTCGSKQNAVRVPYPFGFSKGCSIRLDCSDSGSGSVSIGGFEVKELTAESIFVNVPANCNRSVDSIEPLFGRNYAMTGQNSLMFQNCSSLGQGCLIPTTMLEARLGSRGCDVGRDNISCYSASDQGSEYLSLEELKRTGCRFLFSSLVGENKSRNSTVSFQVAELQWWVHGECSCSKDADCLPVRKPDGSGAFRCRCKEGFEGDGFSGGGGCRKDPHCSVSRYMSGKCGGGSRVVVLIGGIISGAVLMAAVALVCCCIRRQSSYLKNQIGAKRLLWEAAGNSSVPLYPYKEIERATNSFSEKQKLGNGAYGTVYAGKLHNSEWVAIKKIRHRDTDGIEQVMNEIKLLSSVSHPNLVRLLGCCIEKGEQILIYEYMPNGTLSQHLQRERGNGLPWTIRLTIAAKTANAIAYLHFTMNPPIYHRDIKSSNILLDYNYNSKVADFGLSRLGMTDDSHISTAPQGTPGYVDPEYHQNFYLSDKSDVYSFGVVLVEIISALKVVDFSRPHSQVNLAALAIDKIGKGCLDELIDPFIEPNRDAWTLMSIHKVAELAFRCLAFHRDMRPSMMEVADELELIRISSWTLAEEIKCGGSSCSSPCNRSEKSISGLSMLKKPGVDSRRLLVPQRPADHMMMELETIKDGSPLSVQDPWPSEQSSPSTNSLLDNAI